MEYVISWSQKSHDLNSPLRNYYRVKVVLLGNQSRHTVMWAPEFGAVDPMKAPLSGRHDIRSLQDYFYGEGLITSDVPSR